MSVSSHVDRRIDFSRYRTYDWGPADALPTGDARLDKSSFFRDHMQGEVEKQLAARGFQGPTSRRPDLLVHYHASINQRLDVNAADRSYGYDYDDRYGSGSGHRYDSCYGYDDCRGGVITYEQGTLVVDIVDARTKKVIWRGWAQDSLEGVIDNPDRMGKKIHEAVARMMEQFPPRA